MERGELTVVVRLRETAERYSCRLGNRDLGIRQNGGQVSTGADHGQPLDPRWTRSKAAVADRGSGSRDCECGFPGTMAESA